MAATLSDRLRIRLKDEELQPDGDLIEELIQTVSDRICLRLGTVALPETMGSIAVDAAVKLLRRQYYEGIVSEGVESTSVSFVDNILSEYELEFEQYIALRKREERTVHFR
jgi:hypothetical protein